MSLPPIASTPTVAPQAVDQAESPGDRIVRLARQHGISHQPGPNDLWADTVTRLASDDVELDHISLLLVGLRKAGVLSAPRGSSYTRAISDSVGASDARYFGASEDLIGDRQPNQAEDPGG